MLSMLTLILKFPGSCFYVSLIRSKSFLFYCIPAILSDHLLSFGYFLVLSASTCYFFLNFTFSMKLFSTKFSIIFLSSFKGNSLKYKKCWCHNFLGQARLKNMLVCRHVGLFFRVHPAGRKKKFFIILRWKK